MSTTEIIVLVVVIVLAAALVGALVMSRRAKSQREAATHADHLRREADQGVSSTLPEAQVEAKRAEADADEAHLMAERAADRAREARTGVAQEEAHHEHTLREADRLDPRVDDSSDDYRPTTATAAAGDTTPDTDTGTDTGADHTHPTSTDRSQTVAGEDPDTTTQGIHRA